MGRRKKQHLDDALPQQLTPLQEEYAQCCEDVSNADLNTTTGRNAARSKLMRALILGTSDEVTNKGIFGIAPSLIKLIDGASREAQQLVDDSAEDYRRAAIQELTNSLDVRKRSVVH